MPGSMRKKAMPKSKDKMKKKKKKKKGGKKRSECTC